MAFFRQYIAPLIVVLIFALALVAVSARIFLPNEMAAPAPLGQIHPIDALSHSIACNLSTNISTDAQFELGSLG